MVNPTITMLFWIILIQIFYDPFRRTFLAPNGGGGGGVRTPRTPCLRAWSWATYATNVWTS